MPAPHTCDMLTNEFIALVNASVPEPDAPAESTCLLAGESLGANHVTAPCGHRFNYLPLFLEARAQLNQPRPYDTDYVGRGQMRCPYCRQVSNGVLPYVPTLVADKVKNVNWPPGRAIAHRRCDQILARGPKAGQACAAPGFECDGVSLCVRHWQQRVKREAAWGECTPELIALLRKETIMSLRAKLRARRAPIHGSKLALGARLLAQTATA